MKIAVWFKIIPVIACLSFITLSSVSAANLNDAFGPDAVKVAAGKSYDTSGKTDIYQLSGIVIQTLLGILGVIFLSLVIYGGITWMTAEGDEAKVEKAQKIMRNAIIGLIVVIAAYAISFFVINALTSSTLKQAEPPPATP